MSTRSRFEALGCGVSIVLMIFMSAGYLSAADTERRGNSPLESSTPLPQVQALPVGLGPQSIAIADFNGDGFQDLAVANAGSNNVSIVLGHGDGTFSPQTAYGVGGSPIALAVGDFDNDGVQDLVVLTELNTGTIILLHGLGDGTFIPWESYFISGFPQSITVADFDADGNTDFAYVRLQGAGATIMYGRGNGTFDSMNVVHPYYGDHPRCVAALDFNSDGIGDFAMASEFGGVLVTLGAPGRRFSPPVAPTWGWEVDVRNGCSLATGDFNGDGNRDLAVTGSDALTGGGASVFVFFGDGNGGFQDGSAGAESGAAPAAVAATDFDSDGNLDLAVADAGSNSVLIDIGVGPNWAYGLFLAQIPLSVGDNPKSVAVGDFDQDGKPDLAVANSGSNSVSIVLNSLIPHNHPPVAVPKVAPTVECTSAQGALVTLDGSGSTDSDSTPGTNDDIVKYQWSESVNTPPWSISLGSGEVLTVPLALGYHEILLEVTDRAGATFGHYAYVTIVDTIPPEISVSLTPNVLWPPDHRLVDILATVTAIDSCGSSSVILQSISSSEPDSGGGSGNLPNDIQDAVVGTPDYQFKLRSERDGKGSGRVYAVTYVAADQAGNAAVKTATVTVPLNMGNPPQVRAGGS